MKFTAIEELVDDGFAGFVSVSRLMEAKCSQVPGQKGVYMVINPDTECEFLQESVGGWFKGKNPTMDIDILKNNWINGTIVFYIGQTGGRNSNATLKDRLRQYMMFGQGRRIGLWGGRYIWQLKNNRELLICWKVLLDKDPKDKETEYLLKFKDVYGRYPFANHAK